MGRPSLLHFQQLVQRERRFEPPPPLPPPPPQVVLTCFNIMLLALSLMNRSKRRSEASAADAKGAAKLAPSSRLRPGADGVVDGAIKAAPGGSVEGSAVRLRARAV